MSEITLVTATGDRPEAFKQCVSFMQNQTIEFADWIVVDDGHTTTLSLVDKQRLIKLTPLSSARESFRRNMKRLLSEVQTEIVVFIEDDDYYKPNHLEQVVKPLIEEDHQISGSARAKYYNLRYRCFMEHKNHRHASLCQTAIKGPEAKHAALMGLENRNCEMLDGYIWKRHVPMLRRRTLLPRSDTVVGIKGVPGRKGLGRHHSTSLADLREFGYTLDEDLTQLKKWTDPDTVEVYRKWSESYA